MNALHWRTSRAAATLVLSVFLALTFEASGQYEAPPAPSSPAALQAQTPPAFSQQELDQMLAPIALYPDPLLSQILMAATYPLEVVEAARWTRANPNLRGDDAVKAVEQRDWDPSVKSLVAFPQILQMMDEKLDWTERLGDAFLAQESQVMDTIQGLRQKAYAAGNLASNDQIQVQQEGQTIVVQPANPDVVYVPYYDPTVVYGPWWWDDYPPIFWAPWPGYYYQTGFAWGIGITITTGFFFGDCDWHHHRVNVVHVNNFYYNRIVAGERHPPRVNRVPGAWHHDPDHRRGVPYREAAVRERYGHGAPSPGLRREFRGYPQPPSGEGGRRHEGERRIAPVSPLPPVGTPGGPALGGETRFPATPSPGSGERHVIRPSEQIPSIQIPGTRSVETRPRVSEGQTVRQFGGGTQAQPTMPREINRAPAEIRPHAFEGIGRGSEVRDFSARGRSSFEGMPRRQGVPAQQPSGGFSTPRSSAPQPSGGARIHSGHQRN